jgi:ABC-type multidrug transport system fused ATPase/permease subunit
LKKELNFKTLSFFKYIGNYHLFVFAFVFNMMEGLCCILLANYTGIMTNAIIDGNRTTLNYYFFFSLIFVAAILISITVKEYFYTTFLEKGTEKVKNRTFDRLLHAKQEWVDEVHNAEITANASNDINALSNALRPFVVMSFSVIICKIMLIVYLFYVNAFLAALVLCTIPITTYIQRKITKSVKKLQSESMEHVGKMVSVASDCFTYREIIKSMCLEKEFYKRFDSTQNEQYKIDLKTKWINSLSSAVGFIATMLPLMVVVLVSGLLILKGSMTIGTMMIFVTLTFSATRIFSGVSDMFLQGQTLLACVERIMRLWRIPQQAAQPFPSPKLQDDLRISESDEFIIQFDHVDFSYDGCVKILNQCSFNIRPGEVVCLCGESGCGKSTVLKLICNFYPPQNGYILVEHKNINTFEIGDLRENIVYITQEAFMFSASIYDNVTCFDNDFPREQVIEILSTLGLKDKICSMPKGIDTSVGDHGSLLSGGERQRIAIARALMRKAKVILLDEIASGLDTLSEKEILEYFLDLPYKPTIIFITHRMTDGLRVDHFISVKELNHSTSAEVRSS